MRRTLFIRCEIKINIAFVIYWRIRCKNKTTLVHRRCWEGKKDHETYENKSKKMSGGMTTVVCKDVKTWILLCPISDVCKKPFGYVMKFESFICLKFKMCFIRFWSLRFVFILWNKGLIYNGTNGHNCKITLQNKYFIIICIKYLYVHNTYGYA